MMLVVLLNACMAGVGNKLVMESKEANYRDLEKISLLFLWVLGVSSSMLLCLYQPFVHVWMGKENMLAIELVFCFVVYYYSMGANKLINMFKDAAGIWQIDRWRPLTAAFVNLGLNLITVRWLGMYGVLLSSIVSIVLIQIPWLFHNLFREVFPRESMWKYIRLFCGLTVFALISCVASWFACGLFTMNVWLPLPEKKPCFSKPLSSIFCRDQPRFLYQFSVITLCTETLPTVLRFLLSSASAGSREEHCSI